MTIMNQDKIEKIRKHLEDEKLDAALISSHSNITYLTGYSNFSIHEREAFLLITKDKQFFSEGKKLGFIFTDARYSEAIRKLVSHFELKEISGENPITKILKDLAGINVVGIEENNLTIAEYKKIKKSFKKLKALKMHTLRSVKTKEEINKIEKACQIGDETFKFVLSKIQIGITEKQLAYELENFIKQKGADLSFPSIVGFSNNSSVPHHNIGNTTLDKKSGQFILLDFGVKFENYCSDMTRTVFFGKPSGKQRKIYQVVRAAQEKAAEFLQKQLQKNGLAKASKVDKVVRDYILKKGFPSIPHSLGHGIGIEVHEPPYLSPKSKNILESGMVFSIEPGIYLEDFGGVRIEDLFVIEGKNLRQLTKSSKEIIDI